jgi:hypothetical protein
MLNHADPKPAQLCFIVNTGLHQHLRSVDGTKRQNNFDSCGQTYRLTFMGNVHSGRPVTAERQPQTNAPVRTVRLARSIHGNT